MNSTLFYSENVNNKTIFKSLFVYSSTFLKSHFLLVYWDEYRQCLITDHHYFLQDKSPPSSTHLITDAAICWPTSRSVLEAVRCKLCKICEFKNKSRFWSTALLFKRIFLCQINSYIAVTHGRELFAHLQM